MAVMKMHFYNISFDQKDLMKMLMKVSELKDTFYPQDSKKIVNHVKGVMALSRDNPYSEPLNEIERICDQLEIKKIDLDSQNEDIDLQDIQYFIDDMNHQIDQMKQIENNLIEEREENQEAMILLNHLVQANISLDDIQQTHYLTFRFGKIPKKEMKKLEYYQDNHFFYQELSSSDHEQWIVYGGLKDNMGEIDNIFISMNFQEVKLPSFAHGNIDRAINELQEEATNMTKYIEHIGEKINVFKQKYKVQILDIYSQLLYLKKLYDQSQYVVDYSQKNAIYAFSGESIDQIRDQFHVIESLKVMELPVDIYQDRDIVAPVVVKNNSLLQPFENIIPAQSNKFDATWLVALTLMLTSFICLGDIAIGFIAGILGVLLGMRKNTKASLLLKRFGIAILIGGLIYGTAFYQIQLYSPLLIMNFSLVERFVGFIFINVVTFGVLMIVKKMVKGGV